MDVIDAAAAAKGEFTMTTSTNHEQALQAAPAGETQELKAATKPNTSPKSRRVAPAKAKAGKKATPAKKAPKSAKKAKGAKAEGAREGSKTATVMALMQRAKGATLAEIMEAAGWQAHSVRGFISGTLGKKVGLKIESTKREDGQRVYALAK
jgi:hypothetical protein